MTDVEVAALDAVAARHGGRPSPLAVWRAARAFYAAGDVHEIAWCPLHGLHGDRRECFVCGGPVERVPMRVIEAPPPLQ